MAKIFNPLLNDNPFESTAHRFNSMFKPIQKTASKESDFVAYIATPLLDYFVLDAAFALDVSIRILNATASLLKAAYLWTLHQQDSYDLIDKATANELNDFSDNVDHIISSVVAQIFNIIFSTLSLITRPIASVVEAINDYEDDYSYSYNCN